MSEPKTPPAPRHPGAPRLLLLNAVFPGLGHLVAGRVRWALALAAPLLVLLLIGGAIAVASNTTALAARLFDPAVLSALAGILLTHYNGGIGPSEASVMKSVRYVAIVAVGGMANLWGALAMGMILNFLSLRGCFGSYDDAVFGVILIVIMLFAPNGIMSLRPSLLGWKGRQVFGFLRKKQAAKEA